MRSRGPKIPAKHLFRLLVFVGVTQKDVSQRLQVSKTSVSFWASGQRPMPERHLSAILDLMEQGIEQRRPIHAEDALAFTQQVMTLLEDWAIEQGEPRFVAEIAEQCRSLGRDGSDPEKLHALLQSREGQRVRQAFEAGLRKLKLLDRIYAPSPVEVVKRRLRRYGIGDRAGERHP